MRVGEFEMDDDRLWGQAPEVEVEHPSSAWQQRALNPFRGLEVRVTPSPSPLSPPRTTETTNGLRWTSSPEALHCSEGSVSIMLGPNLCFG